MILIHYKFEKITVALAIVILLFLFSACALKGYQIDLKTHLPGNALPTLKETFLELGFVPVVLEGKWQGKPATVERFMKNIYLSDESLFGSERNSYLWADIILYETPNDVNSYKPLAVKIYDKYGGNKPEIKSVLIEAADSLESTIKRILPDAKILRSEYLTGVPLI